MPVSVFSLSIKSQTAWVLRWLVPMTVFLYVRLNPLHPLDCNRSVCSATSAGIWEFRWNMDSLVTLNDWGWLARWGLSTIVTGSRRGVIKRSAHSPEMTGMTLGGVRCRGPWAKSLNTKSVSRCWHLSKRRECYSWPNTAKHHRTIWWCSGRSLEGNPIHLHFHRVKGRASLHLLIHHLHNQDVPTNL